MEFIACSDLHITKKCPRNRIDDYYKELLIKFQFICQKASDTNSKTLVVAGDFFDTTTVPLEVIRDIILILEQWNLVVLVIAGQHDMRYHTKGMANTPLGVLQAAGCVLILNKEYSYDYQNEITIAGLAWGEVGEISAEVVVLHQLITFKDPLYPGQEDYCNAEQILIKFPQAKFVITGDNHKPHVYQNKKGQSQINCGSLMRSTKGQMSHKPAIYKIDTRRCSVDTIFIPIQPAKEVFDLNKIEKQEIQKQIQKKASEEFNDFIASLTFKNKPEFKKTLKALVREVKPIPEVKELINNAMEESI